MALPHGVLIAMLLQALASEALLAQKPTTRTHNVTSSSCKDVKGWFQIQPASGKRTFRQVHIPKTAGSSFQADVVNSLQEGEGFWHGEQCFYDIPKDETSGDVVVTFLRKPDTHVYSQFMECRYDSDWDWWKKVGGQAPENQPLLSNVTTWLSHFSEGSEKDDLGCYHPYNMQTRVLSCAEGGECATHHYKLEPSVQQALRSLNSSFFVGLTEHYQASVCLFHAKAHDMRSLPMFCNCTNESAWASFQASSQEHSVPSHSLQDLSKEDLRMIDKLTEKDALVYQAAAERFAKEISEVEGQFDVKLVC